MHADEMRMRILHVDDEDLFLESTKAFLERLNPNFSIDTATSTEAGLELLKGSEYDVVVADYQMPGMDGLEFLQHLRECGNTVPFIILTGKGREDVAMEALNKGANHYLQKGGDVKSLYETLTRVIQEEVGKKRTDNKITEIEKERQVMLDSVPAMIFRVGTDGRFIYANKRLANACGMIPEDFIDRTTKEIFPEEADEYIESDKEVVNSGRSRTGLIGRFHTPKGIRWVRCDKVPVKDADGNVTSIIGFAVDITEQKQVAEALRFQSEVVANLTAGVAVIRASDGLIVYANPGFEEMFGYNSAELAGMNSGMLYAPRNGKSPEEIQEEIAAALDKYGVWSGEIQSVKRNGSIFWCRVGISRSGAPQFGTVWIAVYEDITKQKQVEDALHESETRYRNFFENVPIGIVLTAWEGQVIALSENMCQMTGYSEAELSQINLETCYVNPEDRAHMLKKLEKEGAIRNFTVQVKRKDGTSFYASLNAIPFIHKGKECILTTAQDITDRIRANEALKESEKKLSQIIQGSSIPSFVLDNRHVITHWNTACEKLTGLSANDMVETKKQWLAFYPRERPVMADFVVDSKPEEEIAQCYEGKCKKSTLIAGAFEALDFFPTLGENGKWLLFTAAPLRGTKGDIYGAIETLQDLTELKETEEERERLLKELEAKNIELQRFTYTVSHDLASPLFAIRGFASILREDLEQGNREDQESALEKIEDSATRMDHLLDDTLQLSRIGRVANPPEDVLFGAILKEAREQTAEHIKTSGVEVSVAEDFPTVHVDRMRIVEVLVNLVTNSIKYMGEQPSPRIGVGYRVEGEETVFFVKDNGIGIDESEHEKVFELFYKLDKKSKGTGAGLAIVKRIIEVHGGRIWIESEKGKGCMVCFTLPVQ